MGHNVCLLRLCFCLLCIRWKTTLVRGLKSLQLIATLLFFNLSSDLCDGFESKMMQILIICIFHSSLPVLGLKERCEKIFIITGLTNINVLCFSDSIETSSLQ